MKRNAWIALAILVAMPPVFYGVIRASHPPPEAVVAPAPVETSTTSRPLDVDFDRAMKRDTARVKLR